MGNNASKVTRKQSGRMSKTQSCPPAPRVEAAADNEYSTNTTQSVNSILINSQHRQSTQSSNGGLSALARLNPEYQQQLQQPTDKFQGKVDHPQQHKLLAQSDYWPPRGTGVEDNESANQSTVQSINQLTATSVASMSSSSNSTATVQIDDCIQRLLDVGRTSKVSRQLCLSKAEVHAICRAAMEVFLSQPVTCFAPSFTCVLALVC